MRIKRKKKRKRKAVCLKMTGLNCNVEQGLQLNLVLIHEVMIKIYILKSGWHCTSYNKKTPCLPLGHQHTTEQHENQSPLTKTWGVHLKSADLYITDAVHSFYLMIFLIGSE